MELPSNSVIVCVTDLQIASEADLLDPTFHLTELNAHVVTTTLLHDELSPGGFADCLTRAAMRKYVSHLPHEAGTTPTVPSMQLAGYAQTLRDHATPGMENLRLVAAWQPPDTWTVHLLVEGVTKPRAYLTNQPDNVEFLHTD